MPPPTQCSIVGFQLDLKGVLPAPKRLPHLLRDLAERGINTLLVEYEDVFPFRDLRIAADPASAWSRADLTRFLRLANRNGLDVIPLQQCLGHLEYLLRWRRFRRFAEDPAYPSTIRVCDATGKALVRSMLEQVIEAHPESRFIHLGMDEAHALTLAAQREDRPPLELFADYLRELLDAVEPSGKTPIIWSDMLQDHFLPGILDEFRDRVILGTWEYTAPSARSPFLRLQGQRVSRHWLQHPDDPDAPPIGPDTRFLEDLPPSLRKLIRPLLRPDHALAPFPMETVWTRLGFRTIGHTAVRYSACGAVLPDFNQLFDTIRGYARAVRRNKQLGVIGTAWARGTTFCPPNFPDELTWPAVDVLARAMGRRPPPFWQGIAPATVRRIVTQLGRCRRDWTLEEQLAGEIERLAASVATHRHEWLSLAVMARVLHLQRRCDFALLEVDYFHPNTRPVDTEWQRRLDEQAALLGEIPLLRARVRSHFGPRCAGAAFEEWVRSLFDLHEERLRAATVICRRKLRVARTAWRRAPLWPFDASNGQP